MVDILSSSDLRFCVGRTIPELQKISQGPKIDFFFLIFLFVILSLPSPGIMQ